VRTLVTPSHGHPVPRQHFDQAPAAPAARPRIKPRSSRRARHAALVTPRSSRRARQAVLVKNERGAGLLNMNLVGDASSSSHLSNPGQARSTSTRALDSW